MNLILYRDDLLEFDRGDLSRCTDGRKLVRRTGAVWWVQFARVRRLGIDWSPQSHVVHALSRFFWIFAIAFYVNLILFPWIGP